MLQNYNINTVLVKKTIDGCLMLVKQFNGIKITYLYGKDAEKMLKESKDGIIRKG